VIPSRASFAGLCVTIALGLVSGCSDWPPTDEGDFGDGPPASDGFCGGTPRPCSGLNGAQCEAMPGCDDYGTCSGDVACEVERSASSCQSRSGCFWSPSCTGTPTGCNTRVKKSCEAMAGCVWTPEGGGSGGAGSGGSGSGGRAPPDCPSQDAPCTSSASCGCGFSCVVTCNACPATCAKQCTSDRDCDGTGGDGIFTPYCVKVTETVAICSPVKP